MKEETAKMESTGAGKKWRFEMGAILPVVAFVISLFSLYSGEMARKDVERLDVIKTEYGLFHDLAQLQLQHANMEHLLATSGQAYDTTVELIRTSSSSLTNEDRAKLLLEERALAHYIFTTYEETFYLWQQSQGNDAGRARMAMADLGFFNDLICNNPRLLWYWDGKKGGRLAREFAPDLVTYYQSNVLKDCATSEDPAGPFGPKGEVR